MLELTVLTVPGCPNGPVLIRRLGEILADDPGVRVVWHVARGEADAIRLGMHGSPTLLVNGIDPLAAPGTSASVSCRVYRDQTRQGAGVPSVAALRLALRQAGASYARDMGKDAVGRGGLGRVAPVNGGSRAVQQRVLRSFAETGGAPSATELDEAAAPYGTDGRTILGWLHAADFLRLDGADGISAAYPFSGAPTPHVVRIDDGPTVFSMCAIDALGISAMVGKSVTIQSAEPGTGAPITVTVTANDGRAVWDPADAVVFTGYRNVADGDRGACAASEDSVPSATADVCCGVINFFTSRAAAVAWADAHPGVTGKTLRQETALANGTQIFGPILRAEL